MLGPFPTGTYDDVVPPPKWSSEIGGLIRGSQYLVTKTFHDSDGDAHPIGESWTFLGTSYSRFDDLLSIHIRFQSGEEWSILLIWKKGHQAEIIEKISNYVAQAD